MVGNLIMAVPFWRIATFAWTALAGLGSVSYALEAPPLAAEAVQEVDRAQSAPAEIEDLREKLGQALDLAAELRAQLRQANAEFRYELRAIQVELEALQTELAVLRGPSGSEAAEAVPGSPPDPPLEPELGDQGDSADQPLPASATLGAASDVVEVGKAVRRWASAWREQRVDDFLSSYSEAYVPSDGFSRSVWEARRRIQIERASFIRLDLSSLVVDVKRDHATASFLQGYESDTYSDVVLKILGLTAERDGWRIVSERVIPQ